MEQDKLLVKKIKELVSESQTQLLTDVATHLGLCDTKIDELKELFVKGGKLDRLMNQNENENITSIKKNSGKSRKPSEYNKFMKTKMAELRANGVPPPQAMQTAAKIWSKNNGISQAVGKIKTVMQSAVKSVISADVIDLDESASKSNVSTQAIENNTTPTIPFTPSYQPPNSQDLNTPVSVPSTPLLHIDDKKINDEYKQRPTKLTRVRFFGSTYLWDKEDNFVYNDDVNNLAQIGIMSNSKNGTPKIEWI